MPWKRKGTSSAISCCIASRCCFAGEEMGLTCIQHIRDSPSGHSRCKPRPRKMPYPLFPAQLAIPISTPLPRLLTLSCFLYPIGMPKPRTQPISIHMLERITSSSLRIRVHNFRMAPPRMALCSTSPRLLCCTRRRPGSIVHNAVIVCAKTPSERRYRIMIHCRTDTMWGVSTQTQDRQERALYARSGLIASVVGESQGS